MACWGFIPCTTVFVCRIVTNPTNLLQVPAVTEGISELSVSVQLELCSVLHAASVLEWCGGAFEKGSGTLY